MVRFLIEGNIWLMGTLSILFLTILSLAVYTGSLVVRSSAGENPERIRTFIGYIKSVALFTLVFGLFGQILGLVDIFDFLSNKDIEVASTILAKGIKLTFHTTVYGFIIYLVSILISLGLELYYKRRI